MRRLLLPLALLALAGGCSRPRETRVDGAWVRLPAVPHQPAAAYFTLHGGATDLKLIDVSSDVAIRSEMHETMRSDAGHGGTGPGDMGRMSAASMTPVASVTVPAHTAVPFAPGGRHVMFFDVNPAIKPGGSMTLTFSFANGLRIQQDAAVVAAGSPPPKGS